MSQLQISEIIRWLQLNYSWRNASIGAIRIARRAGKNDATSATPTKNSVIANKRQWIVRISRHTAPPF